jgi:hypothetical protein
MSNGSRGYDSIKMGQGSVVEGYDCPTAPDPARLTIEKRQSFEVREATSEEKLWDARRYYGV